MNETNQPKGSQHHRHLLPLGDTAFVDTVLTRRISPMSAKKESRQVTDMAAFLVAGARFELATFRL
jgi:hypothetical protein